MYFRFLTAENRNVWDRRITEFLAFQGRAREDLQDAQKQMIAQMFRAKPAEQVDMKQGLETLKIQSAAVGRLSDFCRSLRNKKIAAFGSNSDEAVNDKDAVLANPWCMTNTEFAWAWEYEKSGPVTMLSLPREGVQPSESGRQEVRAAAAEWAKAGATEVSKAGIEHLAEALGLAATAVVFSPEVIIGLALASAIGVSLEEIKWTVAERAARRLNSYYRIEHERRIWLSSDSVNWSDYSDIPERFRPRGPTAGDRGRVR